MTVPHNERLLALAVALAALALTACPNPPINPDGGPVRPDPCNDVNDALTKAECKLATDLTPLNDYIAFERDVDWFRVELPAGLTERDLIRIRGRYAAPQTAVNLTMNVLEQGADGGAGAALGRVIDHHGAGAPGPVELLFRHPSATAKTLFVQLADEMVNPSRPAFDVNNQYTLTAERLLDPDPNEPNDTTPTTITLTGGTGTRTGYLATADDVDVYAVAVPAPTGPRKVLYVRLTAPMRNPPPPYRLSFVVTDPAGTVVSENSVPAGGEFLAVDLGTARLAVEGTWTIAVKGYRNPTDQTAVPGDLTYQYTLEARVLDEVDPNEPNDDQSTATTITLGAVDAPAVSVTGRMDHVADHEWFTVTVPPHGSNQVLWYKATPLAAGGRYPPLTAFPERWLQTFTEVTGFADNTATCLDRDAGVCPAASNPYGLAGDLCSNYSPPRCLYGLRAETLENVALNNFEGAIPLPPASSARTFFLRFEEVSSKWADDQDYLLQLRLRSDADETARYSAGQEQTTVLALPEDPSPDANGFPVPFSGAASMSGTLSHGYGKIGDTDRWIAGDLIRGIDDYDAVPTDVDHYELDLPAQNPADPLDRSWELQWEIGHFDGGQPYELGVEVTFCDGDRLDAGNCTPVAYSRSGGRLVLAYNPNALETWHQEPVNQPAWLRQVGASSTTTTAAPFGCFCFEPQFVKGGKVYLDVVALDRVAYEPVTYQLRTAFTRYPMAWTKSDGGFIDCPRPDAGWFVIDGGLPDGGLPDGGDADGGMYLIPGCRFTD